MKPQPSKQLQKRAPFPLYVKILVWFFLNLLLLAVVVILLINAQFRFDLNWVFATSARERVEAMRNLIVDELNTLPTYEWERVLERFSNAYGVQFAVFDDDGNPLVGLVNKLPDDVRARIFQGPEQRPASGSGEPPPPGPEPPDMHHHGHGPPLRIFMHTFNPMRYWLLLSVRLDNPQAGEPMRAILVAESASFNEGGLIFDLKPWLVFGVGAVVFSVLFWLPLVSGITRVIGQMTHATQQIAEGRFDVRISTRRRDELGVLGDAINQMALRLNGFITGQKRFLGDIAHELCSPLARLQMALGILEERAGAGQQGYVKSASEKAAQIAALVNDLLAFSKASLGASTVRLQPVNLHKVAEEAIRREAAEGVEIQLQVPAEFSVMADSELLIRALSNLLRNAIRYAREAGPITISAAKHGHEITSSVADSGPGVPVEELAKIFDAFYRVDSARTRETGGVGLGLTIVKTCVESCGGTVAAQNRSPAGLEVLVRLPAAS